MSPEDTSVVQFNIRGCATRLPRTAALAVAEAFALFRNTAEGCGQELRDTYITTKDDEGAVTMKTTQIPHPLGPGGKQAGAGVPKPK